MNQRTTINLNQIQNASTSYFILATPTKEQILEYSSLFAAKQELESMKLKNIIGNSIRYRQKEVKKNHIPHILKEGCI